MYKWTIYKTAITIAANDVVVWTNLERVTCLHVKTFNWFQSTRKFDPAVNIHEFVKHLILIPFRWMNTGNRVIIAGVGVLIARHRHCAE
jgi:hypothetical protein